MNCMIKIKQIKFTTWFKKTVQKRSHSQHRE